MIHYRKKNQTKQTNKEGLDMNALYYLIISETVSCDKLYDSVIVSCRRLNSAELAQHTL